MTLSSNSSISGHTAQGSASSDPQWKSLTDSKADMVIKIGGDGDLVFEANSVRLGKNTENLEDRIQRLEHVLGATGRNPEMEDRYPDLKEIGDAMDAEVERIWRESANQLSRIADQYQDLVKQCQLMDKLKENNDL
jgi:hypothetical protein